MLSISKPEREMQWEDAKSEDKGSHRHYSFYMQTLRYRKNGQSASKAQTASYSMAIGGPPTGLKRPGREADHSPPIQCGS